MMRNSKSAGQILQSHIPFRSFIRFRRRLTRDLLAPIAMLPDAVTIRFASHPERALSALREQGFERHWLWDQSLLVHVTHERLERAPIALKSVWPEVLAHQVYG